MADMNTLKELRYITGAGVSDCNKALKESNGDLEKAVEWLRIKGISNSQKKSGRDAFEGLVGVFCDKNKGMIVELNCETDFVAKNEEFLSFVENLVKSLSNSSVSTLDNALSAKMDDSTVSDQVIALVSKCGENIVLRNFVEISDKNVFSYVHNKVRDLNEICIGRIGVLVKLNSELPRDVLSPIGKEIAMHISFSLPKFINTSDVNSEFIEKERSVLIQQSKESGMSEDVIDKVIDGKIRKFLSSICLNEQSFILDNKLSVKDYLSQKSKDLGGDIAVESFQVLSIG